MRFAGIMATIAAAGGLILAAPGAVEAQDPVPQDPIPQEQATVEVTEDLLERFVAVYPAVVEVAQTAQAELATVEDAEAAQAIQAEAQRSITAVLDDGGVSVGEYEAVVMRLNADEELRAEVEEMLLEQQAEAATDGGMDR